ncbi:MAG: pentapeptide repeat-containing protein [Desulfobaccales bacterium]
MLFRDADLSKAVFREANLDDTDFLGADLREANFTTARNLLLSQLAGADLSGSRLPADLEKFASLPQVDAATRHARTLFFTQLLVCVYCWLTISVTTDPGLLTNTIETPLPVINPLGAGLGPIRT